MGWDWFLKENRWKRYEKVWKGMKGQFSEGHPAIFRGKSYIIIPYFWHIPIVVMRESLMPPAQIFHSSNRPPAGPGLPGLRFGRPLGANQEVMVARGFRCDGFLSHGDTPNHPHWIRYFGIEAMGTWGSLTLGNTHMINMVGCGNHDQTCSLWILSSAIAYPVFVGAIGMLQV